MSKTLTFTLNGMHCVACAFTIDGDLEDTEGIEEANTNYAKQTTTITFNEKKILLFRLLKP